MRYIIPLVQKESTFVYTIHIEGFYDFRTSATQINLDTYRDVVALNSQSRWRRFRIYAKAISFLIQHMGMQGEAKFFFIDFQLLAFALWIKKYWRKKARIIYHQIELFDPDQSHGISRKLQQSVLRNAGYIDRIIFPEINRMNFFTKAARIGHDHAFILPNTNNLYPSKSTVTSPLLDVPADATVLAHVGRLGSAHYGDNYFDFMQSNSDPDLRFLFIGRIEDSMQSRLMDMQVKDDRILYIPELPHDELIRYYNRINIGLIFYKGVDLNNEFCAPNKLYEYWAYGIPVIAHALEGLKPVWIMECQGKLIDFENKQQLESAVHQLRLSAPTHKEELKEYFHTTLSFEAFLPAFRKQIQLW